MPTAEQLFFAKYIHTMELSVNQIKQFTVNLSVLLLHLDFHIKGLHPILIAFKPLVWLTSWFLMRVQILHIYLLTDTNRINKLEAKNKNKKTHPLKKILCTFVTLISRNCKKKTRKKIWRFTYPLTCLIKRERKWTTWNEVFAQRHSSAMSGFVPKSTAVKVLGNWI